MNEQQTVVAEVDAHSLSLTKYVVGFLASVFVTLGAYIVTVRSGLDHNVVITIISLLAIVQFLIQMIFFLHIGTERKPRWKQLVLWFMLSIVVIIVFGSVWIMNNLNYRMDHRQMEQYLQEQDGGI